VGASWLGLLEIKLFKGRQHGILVRGEPNHVLDTKAANKLSK
jgi:hypothetical protein